LSEIASYHDRAVAAQIGHRGVAELVQAQRDHPAAETNRNIASAPAPRSQ
jgi:hypothetical protein